MISACIEAGRVTDDDRWAVYSRQAFDWYLGQNELQEALYDASTGGCRDGLHEDRVNENQGAESTLSFLLSLLELRAADRLVGAGSASTPIATALGAEPAAPLGMGSRAITAEEQVATQ